MLGNEQTPATRDHASIGDFPAIVCSDKDLKEDLICVNPLLDSVTWQRDPGSVFLQRPLSTVLLTTNNPPTFWRTDFAAFFQISALF